jgi:hypothetical protein
MAEPNGKPPVAAQTPILVNEVCAAQMLAISPRSLWTLRDNGAIPYVRIHSSIRYRVADLEAFVAQQLSTANGGKR